MKRRLALALIVHAHAPAGREAVVADSVLELLRWPEVAGGAVTWSFPVSLLEHPFEAVGRARAALKPRIQSGSDGLAPCGYSGAPHGALLDKEIERELGWTLRNSWRSGVGRITATALPGFFNGNPDLARETTAERYRRSFGFLIAGFDDMQRVQGPGADTSSSRSALRDLIVHYGGRRYRLPTADCSGLCDGASGTRAVRRLARTLILAARKCPVVALMFQADGERPPDAIQRLKLLLRIMARRTTLELCAVNHATIRRLALDHHAVPAITPAGSDRLTPRLMRALQDVVPLRIGRQSAEQTRTVLQHIASAEGNIQPQPTAAPAADEREYIASMFGAARLGSDVLVASFVNGALCRLDGEEDSVLAGRPSLGWIELPNQRIVMAVQSAFSFESRRARGLSTHATLSGDPFAQTGNLQMDAIFLDSVPWMILDLRIRAPVPAPHARVLRWTPLEIPLCDCARSQGIEIETVYPDGTEGTVYLETHGEQVTRTVWGSLFRIRWEDRILSVGYPSLAGPTVAPIVLQISRATRRRHHVCLHVAGYYDQPELAAQSGAEQHHITLCLAAGEPDAAAIFQPPDQLRSALMPQRAGAVSYPRIG